ncbi:MAG: tetratricopeptide repeat protein [Candidatus Coatesbacteria bacterium]|nr:MAG: tetratricopeptide repeat protein [Candidatus Coatesbacteria bacterium]
MRAAATFLLGAALAAVSCGPPRPAGYFVYEGRRGDSPAALSARFGGDARLAKTLAREAGREAEAPFEAGERVAVRFESLKKHRKMLEAFALVHEGRAHRRRGDYAAAAAALAAAHAAAPDDPALAFELGATYYEAGDYPPAVAFLGTARSLAPDDEEVTLTFALAAAEAGEAAAAVTALEALAAARPGFRYGLYLLGEVQLKSGDYPASRHHLFETLRRNEEGIVATFAREGIKASARAELAAAARMREEAARAEKEETAPPREAGPTEPE